jgi:transposase
MTTELTITTERIDDFPLLLEMMKRLGLPEIIDHHVKRHGLHQGLSWGWITAVWLAHILTESDHRKQPVQGWVKQAHETITRITGQVVNDLDFTDDRLTALLRRLSRPETWREIETELGQNILRVYELKAERVRLDATTVSGHHRGGEESLFQYGHSKDDPTLRQVKVMMAALDPLGLPLVTQVVAGEKADDPLYLPAAKRVLEIIQGVSLLFVGDCKMSALETRAYLAQQQQQYLSPLAMTGKTPTQMQEWIQAAGDERHPLQTIYVENAKGERQVYAEGYEFERIVQAEVEGEPQEWSERVLVVCSSHYRQIQEKGLAERLRTATAKLLGLTPAPGRGKRQIRDEAELHQKAAAILKAHQVEGLLTWPLERQEKHQTKYLGPGRGNPDRPKQELVTVRYQITQVNRQEEAIAALQKTFGWRAYGTNASPEQLSLEQAVLTYRHEWIIERGFHRLKGAPLSLDPLFVKRDDQVVGLTHLLSLAVRMLSLIEFVVRRNLKQNQEKLTGLLPSNPKKGIDNPTTERLLRMFDEVNLTIVHLPNQTIRHITPLTPLQTRILELLGLSAVIYTGLAGN